MVTFLSLVFIVLWDRLVTCVLGFSWLLWFSLHVCREKAHYCARCRIPHTHKALSLRKNTNLPFYRFEKFQDDQKEKEQRDQSVNNGREESFYFPIPLFEQEKLFAPLHISVSIYQNKHGI